MAQEILRQHVPDRPVWVIGSRASGSAIKTSDLDLAIGGDEPLSLDVLGKLREAFSDSDLPFFVDLVDLAATDEGFRARIMREALPLRLTDQSDEIPRR